MSVFFHFFHLIIYFISKESLLCYLINHLHIVNLQFKQTVYLSYFPLFFVFPNKFESVKHSSPKFDRFIN